MKHFVKQLQFLIAVQLTGIVFFTLFRIILFLTQTDQLADIPDTFLLTLKAFAIGLRFDNVMASYLNLLPAIILLTASIFQYHSKWLNKAVVILIMISYTFAFLICAADIPYFSQFYKHINASIFNWATEKSFVIGMIAKEPRFWIFLPVFLLLIATFSFLIFRYTKWIYKDMSKQKRSVLVVIIQVILVLCCLALCVLGMRGRMERKSPIRVGMAYFCEYPFFNRLGLNPVYFFMDSWVYMNKYNGNHKPLMNEEEALLQLQNFLQVHPFNPDFPIARKIDGNKHSQAKNVVLIMMEGMSAEHLSRHGSTEHSCLFLDSLSDHSYYFENCYSAGIHTMNGVYSSLISFPAYLSEHTMKTNEIQIYTSFPYTLKQLGYETFYFSTHDEQFDNIAGFLKANYVQHIIAQKDYPKDKILSTLGVPDDYMFEEAIRRLSVRNDNTQPFFAAFLTASNHSPLIIPEYYHPTKKEKNEQILQYSDWALQKFFALSKQQSWYENTIFVLISDHGCAKGEQLYNLSLPYNHIPFIIFSPSFHEAKVFSQPTSQIDIFPTVMGLLGFPYINNTLGEDAINQPRKWSFFSADNIVASIDTAWLYTYQLDGQEGLYRYKEKDPTNWAEKYPAKKDSMKNYVLSNIQAAKYLIKQNKLFIR